MFCSQCGREVKENMKFCSGCGAVTAAPAAPAEAPAPAATPDYAAYAPPAAAPEAYTPPAPVTYAPPVAEAPAPAPQPVMTQQSAPTAYAPPSAPAAYAPPVPETAPVMQNAAPVQPTTTEKPAKKRRKLPVILSSCAAVVILAAAVAVFFWLNSNPAKTAQTALQKTMLSFSKEMPHSLFPAFLTSEEEQFYTMTLTGDIAQLIGLESGDQAQFNIESTSDPDAGAMYMMLNVMLNMENMGVNLELDVELSLAKRVLALNVPQLLDKSFAVSLDSFISDWNASPMGQQAPIEGENAEQLQEVLDSLTTSVDNGAAPELPDMTEYNEQMQKAWAKLKETFTYEELKDQEIPEGTGSATMIQIAVTDEALSDWFVEIIEIVENYYKDFFGMISSDMLESADLDMTQLLESMNFKELQDVFEDSEFEEVFINIYLDKAKAAQCVELSGIVRYDGNKSSVQIYAGTADTAAPLAEWYAAVIVKSGSDKNTIKAKGSSSYSETQGYSNKLTLTSSDSEEAVTIKLDWNPSGKGDNLSASLQAGELFFEFTGIYLFDDDSLTLGVSKVAFDQYTYSWETETYGYERMTYDMKLDLTMKAQDSYSGKDLSKDALGLGDIDEELVNTIMEKVMEMGMGGFVDPFPVDPYVPVPDVPVEVSDGPVSVIIDNLDILHTSDISHLEHYGNEFCDNNDMSLMIYMTDEDVSYNDNGEQDHGALAENVFRSRVKHDEYGYQNGIVLYINTSAGYVNIYTFDEATYYFSQTALNEILTTVINDLNEDDFYYGCYNFIHGSINRFNEIEVSSITGQVAVFNESDWMEPEAGMIDYYYVLLNDYLSSASYNAAAILLEKSIGPEDPYVIADTYYNMMMNVDDICPPGLVFYLNLEDMVWDVFSVGQSNNAFETFGDEFTHYADWFDENIAVESPQVICSTYFEYLSEMLYSGKIY